MKPSSNGIERASEAWGEEESGKRIQERLDKEKQKDKKVPAVKVL